MSDVIAKNKCCGCTTCLNICPKKAITMVEDSNGFLYPMIDKQKCINCGLCRKKCPILNTKANDSINKSYVAYNRDKNECLNASSGSIFSLIANYILENNGIVVGAAFDENNKLKHIAVEKKEDLEPLRKSKYLQSDLENIFSFIKNKIKDRKVLFVGTPCQVAGIKAFITNNDNLFTIDIFCHGVPSPKLFNKYIRELETKHNDKVLNFDFRDNTTGWDTYSNKISFKNKEIRQIASKNDYMRLFLSDIALRDSCYNCHFKLGNKYADITLGDFWGVKNYYSDMYNYEGVSAIIINTQNGDNMFNNIKKDLIYKDCELDKIICGNPSLIKSSKRPKNRDSFFADINNYTIEQLLNKYKMKNSFVKKVCNRFKKIFTFK